MNQIALVRTLLSLALVIGYFFAVWLVMTQELPRYYGANAITLTKGESPHLTGRPVR